MKRFLILALVIGLSMTIASSAFAGIVSTRHNLSNSRTGAPPTSSSGGTVIYSTDQDQLCVWCHTPHAASSGVVPLWNKSLTGAGFTYYGTTIAGTPQVTAISAISRACLTCHDGTLAINIVVNAPGTGGYNAAGAQFGTWQGLNTASGFGNALLTSVTNVGTDLSNDHPISIIYSALSATTDDNPGSLRQSSYTLSGTTPWISRRIMANANIGAQLVGGLVECATCHDPHTAFNPLFLRATTAGSKICLSCHDK